MHTLTEYPGGDVALVTHATVLSLFVARHSGRAAFDFWRLLTMPAVVVFDLPGFALREVITDF
jgi:broad specificity phosphatase PhoE